MRNAVVMAIKDLHLLWRDKFALFWVAVFPLMMALFVGAIFGGSGPTAGMSVAVVDLDSTAASRSFVETLDRVRGDPTRRPATTARTYTRDSARQAVAAGDVTAYLLVPTGYGRDGDPAARTSAARRSSSASIRRAAPRRATCRAWWSRPRSSGSARPGVADFEPVRSSCIP